MVAQGGEKRHRCAGARPERRPENRAQVGTNLHQVAIVVLAARRVAIVAGGDGEARAAAGDALHQVGLLGVRAGRVDRAPVAKDREGKGLCVARWQLRPEARRRVSTKQVGATEVDAIAVLCIGRKRKLGAPLIFRNRVDRQAGFAGGDAGGRRTVAACINRPPLYAASAAGAVGRPVDRRRREDDIGEVGVALELAAVGNCCGCGLRRDRQIGAGQGGQRPARVGRAGQHAHCPLAALLRVVAHGVDRLKRVGMGFAGAHARVEEVQRASRHNHQALAVAPDQEGGYVTIIDRIVPVQQDAVGARHDIEIFRLGWRQRVGGIGLCGRLRVFRLRRGDFLATRVNCLDGVTEVFGRRKACVGIGQRGCVERGEQLLLAQHAVARDAGRKVGADRPVELDFLHAGSHCAEHQQVFGRGRGDTALRRQDNGQPEQQRQA